MSLWCCLSVCQSPMCLRPARTADQDPVRSGDFWGPRNIALDRGAEGRGEGKCLPLCYRYIHPFLLIHKVAPHSVQLSLSYFCYLSSCCCNEQVYLSDMAEVVICCVLQGLSECSSADDETNDVELELWHSSRLKVFVSISFLLWLTLSFAKTKVLNRSSV